MLFKELIFFLQKQKQHNKIYDGVLHHINSNWNENTRWHVNSAYTKDTLWQYKLLTKYSNIQWNQRKKEQVFIMISTQKSSRTITK